MAAETTDNIVIPVTPSDGEAAGRNSNAITKCIRSTYRKISRFFSKVRAKSGLQGRRSPVESILTTSSFTIIGIIRAAPSDGEADGRNSNAITKCIRSTYRKLGWLFSKSGVQGQSPAQRILVQLQPVVVVVQEHELGKLLFSLGAPLTIGLIITGAGKTTQTTWGHVVLMGVSSGCILIFTGILFRTAFPTPAKVMEHTGIALVITSFNGLVASALPPHFAWFPMLTSSICILTLLITVLPNDPPDHIDNTVDYLQVT